MIGIFIDGLSEWPFRPLPICRSIRISIEGSCPAIQGEGGKRQGFLLSPLSLDVVVPVYEGAIVNGRMWV